MRNQHIMVQEMAHNVRLVTHDLSSEYGLDYEAERLMKVLKKRVSPDLWESLAQQLLAFQGDMQVEMAENLLIFTDEHVAHTTGCTSADTILDICYTWIAMEHSILKRNYKRMINNGNF